MSFRLDDIDRKILSELQLDAGQYLEQIAQKVSSSKTPVWNRIKKNERLWNNWKYNIYS